MYCENCGKKNDDTATKCVNCGYRLEKKDLFSFDEDDFKIDSKDFESIDEDIFNNDKLEKEETKTKIEKEEIEEAKTIINNEAKRNINNTYNKAPFPLGKNKHMVDFYAKAKDRFIVGLVLLFFIILMPSLYFFTDSFQDSDFFLFVFLLFFIGIGLFLTIVLITSIKDTNKAKKALNDGKNSTAEIVYLYTSNSTKRSGKNLN